MNLTDLVTTIDEAGKLDKLIKANTVKLKDLKSQLADHFKELGSKKEEGTKYKVSFSVTPRYSDISPVACHDLLEARGLGAHILEVVKIQVTPLKKFLSGEEVDSLREKTSEVVNVKLDPQ